MGVAARPEFFRPEIIVALRAEKAVKCLDFVAACDRAAPIGHPIVGRAGGMRRIPEAAEIEEMADLVNRGDCPALPGGVDAEAIGQPRFRCERDEFGGSMVLKRSPRDPNLQVPVAMQAVDDVEHLAEASIVIEHRRREEERSTDRCPARLPGRGAASAPAKWRQFVDPVRWIVA